MKFVIAALAATTTWFVSCNKDDEPTTVDKITATIENGNGFFRR